MRLLSTSTLAVSLAACAGANAALDAGLDTSGDVGQHPAADAAGAAGDPTVEAWLKEHDDVRASAKPTPSPALPKLTWNAAAASVASAWAAHCDWNHNPSRGNYGENIAAATSPLTPAAVVAMWAAEASNYDYATNGCSGVCGHYTQIVWRDTTSVGCAIQKCTSGSPFGSSTWYFAVCDYAPPGNFVGAKPY